MFHALEESSHELVAQQQRWRAVNDLATPYLRVYDKLPPHHPLHPQQQELSEHEKAQTALGVVHLQKMSALHRARTRASRIDHLYRPPTVIEMSPVLDRESNLTCQPPQRLSHVQRAGP